MDGQSAPGADEGTATAVAGATRAIRYACFGQPGQAGAQSALSSSLVAPRLFSETDYEGDDELDERDELQEDDYEDYFGPHDPAIEGEVADSEDVGVAMPTVAPEKIELPVRLSTGRGRPSLYVLSKVIKLLDIRVISVSTKLMDDLITAELNALGDDIAHHPIWSTQASFVTREPADKQRSTDPLVGVRGIGARV